jgi:hypothetical protein
VRQVLLERRSELMASVTPLVSEIVRLREELSAKIGEANALNSELDQINAAIRAMEVETKNLPTIMQAVLEVLREHPDGMTALEILAEINTRYFGGRIERTSLSPQLSRLKDRDGKIDLRGSKWLLLPEQPTLPLERRL